MGLIKTHHTRLEVGFARLDKVNLYELKADVHADVCFLWSTKQGKNKGMALKTLCSLCPLNTSGKNGIIQYLLALASIAKVLIKISGPFLKVGKSHCVIPNCI